MNVTDAIKEALAVVPRFAQDFVNILVGPRSYAATGAVFNAGKFKEALVLLAVSLVVTLVAKGSMMAFTGSPLPVLAADAIWKFVVVLVVFFAIWISWRILGVAKAPGAYIVAGSAAIENSTPPSEPPLLRRCFHTIFPRASGSSAYTSLDF